MNNREQYRVAPDEGAGFHVRVTASGCPACEGVLFDASVGGVGVDFMSVEFSQTGDSVLCVGETVDLHITSATLQEPLQLSARIVHRVDGEFGSRLGFRFENEAILRRRRCPELFRIFNRRQAFRVEVDPREPVAVALHAAGGRPVTAQLVDLSAGGMALRTPAAVEAALLGSDSIDATFTLPGDPDPIRLPCVIRHRRLVGSEIQYGIQFDEEACEHAGRERDAIMRYVMDRQRTNARRETHVIKP